jgi:hypothetical protein
MQTTDEAPPSLHGLAVGLLIDAVEYLGIIGVDSRRKQKLSDFSLFLSLLKRYVGLFY